VQVCPAWQVSFENFWKDMGPTYQKGLTLDRIDNDKGYSPENCRWVDWRAQAMNRRNTERRVDVVQLSKETGISRSTLYYRLKHGWPVEKLTLPPNPANTSMTSSTQDHDTDS
jgi:predicted DNA-binding transcriptional regulator AlpA